MRKYVEAAILCAIVIMAMAISNKVNTIGLQNAHRERVINSLYSVVIICDATGKPTYISDNITDSYGWDKGEVYEGGVEIMIASDDVLARHEAAFRRSIGEVKSKYLYSGTPSRRIINVKCKDGSTKESAIRMFAATEGNEIFMYAAIMPMDTFEKFKDYPRAEGK